MIHIYLNINNVSLCWQQSQNYCSNARCSSTVSSSWVVNLLVFTFNWCRLAGRPSTKRSLNRLHNTVTQVVIQPASVWNWKGKLWSSSSAAYAGLIHSILWMHAQRKREREREREQERSSGTLLTWERWFRLAYFPRFNSNTGIPVWDLIILKWSDCSLVNLSLQIWLVIGKSGGRSRRP